MSVKHYPLGVGEIIIVRDGGVISTTLGMSVALCIFSIDGQIGGMNHFLLPKAPTPPEKHDLYRYGDTSCQTLIDTFL